MKSEKCFLVFWVTILMYVFCSTIALASNDPLDKIEDYEIKVDMRTDGTMDITYHIEWRVLDSDSEGPLEWVKIGCPNKHVDEITALTSNINEIQYYSDGGAYIRIDFDKEYYAGEVVVFEYSIHQSYMYVIEEDTNLCRYSFTPGWFDEAEVENIIISWNSKNVIDSTADYEEDGYLIWTDSLEMGERLNASVKYNLDVFDTNEDEQYTEEYEDSSLILGIILIIFLFVIIIAIIVAIFSDDYNSGSGFRGGHSTIFVHSSCARSSCACASCACACACAGGGRAGCSKKDFYHTNLKTDDIKKVLKESK